MKPKYKFNLSIILASVLVLCTLTGMGISIRRCMELADYCKNENMSATALDFSENMVFHAYYWMGIAFICICLTAAMPLWYFHHQKKAAFGTGHTHDGRTKGRIQEITCQYPYP